MHLKVLNKWSNKSFDMLLKLLLEVFLDGTNLLGSHYKAKAKLHDISLGYKSIHVCMYDCALFWKENSKLDSCPICGESCWDIGKQMLKKVMRYYEQSGFQCVTFERRSELPRQMKHTRAGICFHNF